MVKSTKKKEEENLTPNLIVSVSALPKAGKNHFAYSAPDPIKVYCFNGGASFVAQKFPDKKIDIHDFILPIVDSTEERWALPIWEEFYKEYREDIRKGEYLTYVLDTGTEVENVCQQALLEELQDKVAERGREKQKLATTEFLSRNLRMKALFDSAKNSGNNLICLNYLKEEWLKEQGKDKAEPTGKLVMDGWKRTGTLSDINLELYPKRKGQGNVTVAEIMSNRFDRDLSGKTLEDATWDDLVALFFGGE